MNSEHMSEPRALVRLERTGSVASVILDRAEASNAINFGLRSELLATLGRLAIDDSIRIVLLTAEGRVFCAGADLKEGIPTRMRVEDQIRIEYLPIFDAIASLPQPVIAALPGPAIGIGMSLALVCDLIVMVDTAYLHPSFTSLGLSPDGGASRVLVQRLGYARAFQFCAEGTRISAQQCLLAGLVNKLCSAEELRAVSLSWAGELAERSPSALSSTKDSMRHTPEMSLNAAIAYEARLQGRCAASADFAEATKAFEEKRSPRYRVL